VLSVDGFDLDDRELLPVAALVAVAFTAFLFENDDLFAALVFEDGGLDRRSFDCRRANAERITFADCKHIRDGYGVTGRSILVTVDEEHIALLDRKLPPLGLDRRFHFGKNVEKMFLPRPKQAFFPSRTSRIRASREIT